MPLVYAKQKMKLYMQKVIITTILLCICRIGLFSQSALNPVHEKDWYKLDPVADSIAGIGFYKAKSLMQDRSSVPVIVAVIDNGVDIRHTALRDHIWTNTKEIPGNGIDDDHNGYIDDIHAWNFRGAEDGTIIENEQAGATQIVAGWKNKKDNNMYQRAEAVYLEKIKNSTDTADTKYAFNASYNSAGLIANDNQQMDNHSYGSPLMKLSSNLSHGTHVAGIICAIDSTVLIMPVVASTAVGDERDKDVANAIRYAVDNGAKIINMSFSKIFSSDKEAVDAAIE